jgi:hypothetical protein
MLRILSEERRIEKARDRIIEFLGTSELEWESFTTSSAGEVLSVADTPSRPNSVVLFSDVWSTNRLNMGELSTELLNHPESMQVAVRYQEIADVLRDSEIHADIMGIDHSVSSLLDAVTDFFESESLPGIFVYGAMTTWTKSVSKQLSEIGHPIFDNASQASDLRFHLLVSNEAFDVVLLESLAELEYVERLSGLSLEDFPKSTTFVTSDPTLRHHLRQRAVRSEFLIGE